jgi:hypothetical protein
MSKKGNWGNREQDEKDLLAAGIKSVEAAKT